MVPSPYRLETLIREFRHDLDDLETAGLIKFNYQPKALSSAVNQVMRSEREKDAALGAVEGAVLYGGGLLSHLQTSGIWDQLHHFDTQLISTLSEVFHDTVLNTANLSTALATIGTLVEGRVSPAFQPFAMPIINGCLSHAHDWCQEHVLNTVSGVAAVGGAIPEALHGNLDGLTSALSGIQGLNDHAWLNASESITANPLEVISTHIDHADTAVHAGETIAHGAVEAGVTHVADHAASAVIHIPWFSLARSGYREFNLHRSGKTDVGTASKNIALDAGPMALGSKAGAVIGSMIFPGVGTAIGAGLGGIAGKFLGTHVKQADLRSAVSNYEMQKKQLSSAQDELNTTIVSDFDKQKISEQGVLNRAAVQIREDVARLAKAHETWQKQCQKMAVTEAEKFIVEAVSEIDQANAELATQLNETGRTKRWIWPEVEVEARRLALVDLAHRKREASSLLVDLRRVGYVSTSELLEKLAQLGVSESRVREFLKRDEDELNKRRVQLQTKLEQSQTEIQTKRYQAVMRLDLLLKGFTVKAKEKLEPLAKKLEVTGTTLLREKEKLGMA